MFFFLFFFCSFERLRRESLFLIYYSGVFLCCLFSGFFRGSVLESSCFQKRGAEKMTTGERKKEKKSVNEKKHFFFYHRSFFRFVSDTWSPLPLSLPINPEDILELVIAVALHPFNLPKSTSNHHRTSSFSRARQKSTRLKALQRPLPAPRAWPTGPRPCALPVE